MKKERTPFDFNLWGQEGIEVWHVDGRKAVYVGTTAMPFYLFHWDDGSFSELCFTDVYMTRQVKQKTFEEVIEDAYNVTNPLEYTWYSLADDSKVFYRSFVNEVIRRAKDEGLI